MNDIRHDYVEVNGIRLHIAHSGSGPALLFLHGFPEFWYAWRHQLNDLADRFHCIAPDTRGINLSAKPQAESAYTLEHLSADAARLIEKLCAGCAVVIGHDWGGFTAWELALRYPRLVRKLVIINCAHPDAMKRLLRDSERQQAASQYMLAFRSERGEELLSRNDFGGFRANILEPGLHAGNLDRADVEAYLSAWRQPGALTGGLNYYRANRSGPASPGEAAQQPLGPQATRINVPTLVIWGEKDPYFSPENLDLLPEYAGDLRIERFAENDHWIVHQMPRRISQLIRDFASID